MIVRTYKYRLYPSSRQLRRLEETLETCRRWYNTCLAERKSAWENEHRNVRHYEQLARVKEYRRQDEYAARLHSHILQVVATDLDNAFQAFFRRVKSGEKPGYPRFKGKNRFDSFGLKEYRNGFQIEGRRLRLAGIGRVRLRWHRPLVGRIKTVRLCRQAGQWYACFACEVLEHPLPATGREVGIDVGLHHLLVTSDNEVVDNLRWYRTELRKLRVLQRRVSRRKLGGVNRKKAVLALQRQHDHVSQRRKDYLNKLACSFITRYERIALEDLQISNMVQNHHISKSIMDAGWGYLRKRLIDKAAEAGRQVVLVNPAYTSKTCCSCDALFPELSLADRRVDCACGLSLDRDVNAACNILKRAGHARWDISTAVGLGLSQKASPA